MRKTIFTIGTCTQAYIGYTRGDDWNGWATPHFEIAEAMRVMADYNKDTGNPMWYDKDTDTFHIAETEYTDECIWSGRNCNTNEGVKHLYGIGAYCWTWEIIDGRGCSFLAEGIEDFIYEYDTYEAKDLYNDRNEMTEAIKNQLKELKTFQQAYEIWHAEDLSQDEKFTKLGGILKL